TAKATIMSIRLIPSKAWSTLVSNLPWRGAFSYVNLSKRLFWRTETFTIICLPCSGAQFVENAECFAAAQRFFLKSKLGGSQFPYQYATRSKSATHSGDLFERFRSRLRMV